MQIQMSKQQLKWRLRIAIEVGHVPKTSICGAFRSPIGAMYHRGNLKLPLFCVIETYLPEADPEESFNQNVRQNSILADSLGVALSV